MLFQFSPIERILLSFDVIPHPFTDAGAAVGLGHALGTAVKVGIADALTLTPQPVAAIAARAGVSETGAELVLDCLEALGYASRSDVGYAFSKRGATTLAKDSPTGFRYFILFCDYLAKTYADLDTTVRLGRRDAGSMLAAMTEHEWELFSRAMIEISRTNLAEVIGKLKVPAGARRALDLGGSHGQYSIELCRRYPQLQAVVMDLPPVQRYADECIGAAQAGDKVSFLAGDFLADPLPGDQDVVFAFNIVHGLNLHENEVLARKVAASLRPGGMYVVLDQIKGIGGRSQLSRATTAYMALNLLHQAGGRTDLHPSCQDTPALGNRQFGGRSGGGSRGLRDAASEVGSPTLCGCAPGERLMRPFVVEGVAPEGKGSLEF